MDIWKKNFISTFHLFCVCKFTSLALFLKSFDIVCNATDTAHKMLFFPSHKVQCQGGKIILCWMVWCFHEKIIWQSCQQFSFLQIKKCREICTIYVKKCKCMYFTDDLIWNSIFLKSNTVGKNFEKSAIEGRCLQFCLKEKKIRFFLKNDFSWDHYSTTHIREFFKNYNLCCTDIAISKKFVKTHIIVVALFLPCLTHGEQVSVTC